MDRDAKGGSIIYNPQHACDAVRKLGGHWTKTEDLPRLPMKDCTYGGNCECKFKFYDDPRGDDRRKAHDRREDLRFELDHDDRRQKGRRSGDAMWKIGI